MSKIISLIDRLKYTCMRRRSRGVPVPTDSCISVTTVMDVSQLYRAIRDNMWSIRLWRETYWILGQLMTTHVSFEVTVPSTLIVTNWAAERSFTSVNMLKHAGEWSFSFLVCDYQCRWDCDLRLKRHMRRHKSPTAVDAQHIRWSSEWPIDHNSFLFVWYHIFIP